MTTNSTVDKVQAGGDGVNNSFTFNPMIIYASTDLEVTYTDMNGLDTLLTEGTGPTNYAVVVASYPGTGSITYPASGTGRLLSAEKITMKRVLPLTQQLDLQNQGGYFPDLIETALDKLAYQDQQLQETLSRCIKLDVSDSSGDADTFIQTVLQAVADSGQNAADAEAALTEFQNQYLGAQASDPTVDHSGNPVNNGDLYVNTATGKLRIYNSGWFDSAIAAPANFTQNLFNGTGSQTAFVLSTTPASVQSCVTTIAGVVQRPTTDFTLSGNTLTFGTAPASGTNNVQVLVVSTLSIGTPADGSVTPAKLSMGVGVGANNLPQLDGNGFLQASVGAMQAGQCRLTKSGSNLLLSRFQGTKLMMAGQFRTIPSGGVTLAPTGLTPGTTYYIYAAFSGSMSLYASTTGYIIDGTGTAVDSSNVANTLVGMATPVTGPAWADTNAGRYVLSYFNRQAKSFHQNASVAGVIAVTTSYGEKTATRIQALNWGNSDVVWSAQAQFNAGGTTSFFVMGLHVDSTLILSANGVGGTVGGNCYATQALSTGNTMSEGVHTYSIGASTNTGTAGANTWSITGTIFG